MTRRVFVTRTLPPSAQQTLISLQNVTVDQWTEDRPCPPDILRERLCGADGLLCLITDQIDDNLLKEAGQSLKVISTMSVGYDHIDVEACRRRNVAIGNTPGVLTNAVADTTIMLLLMTIRRAVEAAKCVAAGEWGTWSPVWMCGHELARKTVGIVGFGRIGKAVAQRLFAFGVENICYTRSRTENEDEKKETSKIAQQGSLFGLKSLRKVELDDLLPRSDIIIVLCALNHETSKMFDTKRFLQMKKNAVFVNAARGGIVCTDSLVEVLKMNHLFGVGLDVTDPEPLPSTHPLLDFQSCTVLPHIGSATWEAREAMGKLAVENLERGISGDPLLHEI